MSLLERIGYSARAALHSRKVAENPVSAALFLLLPERLAARWYPVCRFHHGSLQFYARRADWGPVERVLLGREYDFALRLLDGLAAPVVLDLGANIGTFALSVFATHPDAWVHSVEPGESTYQVLERNREANPGCRWRTLRSAVWSYNGTLRFQSGTTASTLGRVTEDGTETVPAISLADLVRDAPPIDLVKMDIEGAEEVALLAGEAALGRITRLALQVHPARMRPDAVRDVLSRTFGHVYEVVENTSPNPLWLAVREPLQPAQEAGLRRVC